MLSRKNSKCDLLDTTSATTAGGQKPPQGSSSSAASESRSEAASVCGDNTSVLSSNSNLNKANAAAAADAAKRDSLTGDGGGHGGQLHQQPQIGISDSELDSGLGSSILGSGKEW